MELSWSESVLSNRERVMKELIQGRELASQLCRVLDDHKSTLVSGCGGGDGGDVGSAEGLVNKILGSFANTLLILNGKEADDGEIVSGDQIQGNSSGGGSADSSSWDASHAIIKSEDFHEEISCKSASTFKDRRGSYKRRKISHSWTRDTPNLTHDGHAWRKYGQKVIHNAKHPRNYFRCTHKFDQSCQATKHVQQIQDDPPVFRTTYYGNHTCRDCLKISELVLDLDCTSPREPSNYIRFGDFKQDHPFFSSFTSVKKEVVIKEEKPQPSDDHMMASHHHNHSSSCDYIVSPHPTAFESSCPLSGLSSTIDPYDHEGDVMSRLIVEPYYFDDEVLQYEF